MSKLVDSTMDRIIQECKTEGWFLGTVNAREVIRKHIARSLTALEAENARLEKADETRAQDISRLTIERDKALDRLAEALKALDEIAGEIPGPWDEKFQRVQQIARRTLTGGKVE